MSEKTRPVPETATKTAEEGEARDWLQPPPQWTGLPTMGVISMANRDDVQEEEDMVEVIIRYRTLNGRTYHHDREDNQYW